MSNVINFDFNNTSLRVIEINNQPWFVAADVCRSIGYAVRPNGTTNASLVRSILGEDETFTTQASKTGRTSLCISESGLYKLIMRSDKPEARAFQDWVTKVVLPAIRKDGAYVMGEEKVVTGEMSEEELILRAHEILVKKVERLTAERDEARLERDGLADTVGKYDHTLTRFVRTIPGINTQTIKRDLKELKYLYHDGKSYRRYAKFSDFFVEKFNDQYGKVDIFPTEKGKALIARLAKEGKLTKLKNAA